MAIYHCSVSTVGRSAGRSAVAAAAYRAAEKMQDKRTGEIHDYTRKEGVKYSEIIAPKDAPAWTRERESLWNAAEAAESRKNSTVAREITVALPCELGPDARYQLAAEFAEHLSERYGVVVDMNIHHPKRQSAKDRPKGTLNYHAHLLLTTRRISPEGFTEKTRELDVKTSGEIEHIRAAWADHANRALNNSYKGFLYGSRIDHRSLKAQGIERVPTKHMGPAATAMERRGIKTDKGRWNRRVAALHRARNRAAREAVTEERRLENVAVVYARQQEKLETAALLAQVQQSEASRQVKHQAHDQAHDQAQQIKAEIHAPKQPVQAQEPRRQDNAGGLGAAPPVQGAERPGAAVQRGAALPNHQPDLKAQEKQPEQRPEPKQPERPEWRVQFDKTPYPKLAEQFEALKAKANKPEPTFATVLEKQPDMIKARAEERAAQERSDKAALALKDRDKAHGLNVAQLGRDEKKLEAEQKGAGVFDFARKKDLKAQAEILEQRKREAAKELKALEVLREEAARQNNARIMAEHGPVNVHQRELAPDSATHQQLAREIAEHRQETAHARKRVEFFGPLMAERAKQEAAKGQDKAQDGQGQDKTQQQKYHDEGKKPDKLERTPMTDKVRKTYEREMARKKGRSGPER